MAPTIDPRVPMTANVSRSAAAATPDTSWWVWLWFLTASFWPRFFIVGFWIFGGQIGDAFDGWIVPLLGFLLLPGTTLAYALMWGVSSNTVSGVEWLVVAAGFLLDISAIAALKSALRRE
jgi:hypothetical protein